jgi:hypothetical protein
MILLFAAQSWAACDASVAQPSRSDFLQVFERHEIDVPKIRFEMAYPEGYLFQIRIYSGDKIAGHGEVYRDPIRGQIQESRALDPSIQKAGFGTLLLLVLAQIHFDKTGDVLASNANRGQLTPNARATWERAIERGFAFDCSQNGAFQAQFRRDLLEKKAFAELVQFVLSQSRP